MKICTIDGCDRKHAAKGYCIGHYNRMLKGQPLDTPFEPRQKAPENRRCTHPGCDRPYLASGYCAAHWRRAKDRKDMDAPMGYNQHGSTAERFEKFVERHEVGCWLWRGAITGEGRYGQIWDNESGRHRGAHVVAWELANDQSVPRDRIVTHVCDNPPCVRPDHLKLDTYAGNMQQKVDRGRCPRGSKHGMSKLSERDVLDIRQGYEDGQTQRELASQFGITQPHISSIVRRQIWTHI